jgi:hypothetical protein
MKHAGKIKIVGRTINIWAKSDVAKTFARVRREQAESAQAVASVTPIKRRVK